MNDFKRLLKYVRPYWLTFVMAFIAMVLGAVFETATGAMFVPIINQFLPGAPTKSKTLFDLSSLIPLGDWFRAWMMISVLLITFTVAKGVAEYFSSFLMAKIGQSAVLKLREELYAHLLKQSAVFFEKHRTNYLVSRLVMSCSAIELAMSSNLRDVLRESCMLVFFLAAAFYYNWRLTLGSLIIAPVIAFLTSNFSRRLRKLADVSLEGNKALNDTSQETLSNQIIVKAYSAEPREQRRFMDVARLIARSNLRSAGIAATSPPTIELVGMIAIIVLFYFGLREIDAGRMDPAQFFAFLFFLLRSYDPMRKISRQHNESRQARFAAPAFADEGDHLALFYLKVDIFEDFYLTVPVIERDVFESDAGFQSTKFHRIRFFRQRVVFVHDAPNIAGGGKCFCDLVMLPRDLSHRVVTPEQKQ